MTLKNHHGPQWVSYERDMLKTYGLRVVAELDGLRANMGKVTDDSLSEMLQQYKAML